MTAPAAPSPRIVYRGFSPLILNPDAEVQAKAKGLALDMREESRVLHLARDLYDRVKRWVAETNKKGAAAPYLHLDALAVAPAQRAGFAPKDRLYLEVDRHEQVFNPDPLGERGSPPGVVFSAATDLRDAVATFDLRPFVEAYVRRLSGVCPEYVWQIGERYYVRTNGFMLQPSPARFDPRRFPVPKQVVEAFGPLPPAPPLTCAVCGKADDRVAMQPDPSKNPSHATCIVPKA